MADLGTFPDDTTEGLGLMPELMDQLTEPEQPDVDSTAIRQRQLAAFWADQEARGVPLLGEESQQSQQRSGDDVGFEL